MKGSMTIQPHYIEAARRTLIPAAAERYAAGDMSSTDDAGHEAIAAMAGDVLEEWSDIRREIREKLAAEAALTWLYHSHGDDRGLALANTLEDEAHALWRGMGNEDIPTYLLTQKCGEAAQ